MENLSVANLYELYAHMGNHPEAAIVDDGMFRCVITPNYELPNMAYKPGKEAFLKADLGALKIFLTQHSSCKTLLLEDGLSDGQVADLKSESFLPVAKWVNMGKALSPGSYENKVNDLVIIDCTTEEDINSWLSVASNVLFKDKAIPGDALKAGVQYKTFKLLLGKYNNTDVATVLLYLGNSAGIYMVATNPAYQKKGIGNAMMQYAEDAALRLGYEAIYLHSTVAGLKLYNSLGYTPFNNMLLFHNFNR